MVLYPESDGSHTAEETWNADRPPQLNGTVCSCQSGSGCNHELEGGSGSDVHGDEEPSPQSPDGPEQRVEPETGFQSNHNTFEGHHHHMVSLWGTTTATFDEIRARFGGSFNRLDRMRRTQRALGLTGATGDDDDIPDSLINEPLESGDHSVVVSEKGSVRCISPGPGVGAWTTDGLRLGMGMGMGMEMEIRQYYFVVSPLRLTPQRRNCRGLLASHLVVGDSSANSSDVSNYF